MIHKFQDFYQQNRSYLESWGCILLGSNIAPEYNLPKAIDVLRKKFAIIDISSAWETPAIGTNGPDFLNAAAIISCNEKPEILKYSILRPLESMMGRRRSLDKYAPRTIDFDLIIWNGNVLDHDIYDHAHMVVPVSQLLPCYISPSTGESLEDIANKFIVSYPIRCRPEIILMPMDSNQEWLCSKNSVVQSSQECTKTI